MARKHRIVSSDPSSLSSYALKANGLNQYDRRSFGSSVHVSGFADPASAVNVNTARVDPSARVNAYFHKTVGKADPGNYDEVSVTVDAFDGAAGSERETAAAAYPGEEVFAYDDNGNLTQDAKWLYDYDDANQLIGMTTRASGLAVGVPEMRVEYRYDYMGRR